MASLKEIKNRIASVKSTLKITSAMKLVASAKLRKAQKAIEGMRPYEQELQGILARALNASTGSRLNSETVLLRRTPSFRSAEFPPSYVAEGGTGFGTDLHACRSAVVAIASNSSLCGGFNANAVKMTLATIKRLESEGKKVTVYSIGRKMSEAMKKAGYPSPADFSHLAASASYAEAEKLASLLMKKYDQGFLSEVILVYNHFVSTASQKAVEERYLPFDIASGLSGNQTVPADTDDYILEPDAEHLVGSLMPQLIRLKLYAAILDSAAAEHAARTVAMQTASDNAENLISELTLEYNKGRQQKITSEILDLLGGAQ